MGWWLRGGFGVILTPLCSNTLWSMRPMLQRVLASGAQHTTHSQCTGDGGLVPTVANPEPWDSVPSHPSHRKTSMADASAGKRSVQQARNFALENSRTKASLAVSKANIAQTSWKPRLPRENHRLINGRRKRPIAQTARQGRARARAGSPSVLVTSGRRRQTSTRQNQRIASFQRPLSARSGAAARLPCFWLFAAWRPSFNCRN